MTTPILPTKAAMTQTKLTPTELIQDTADERFLASYYGLLANMQQAWRKGYSGVTYNSKSLVEAANLDALMTRYEFTTVRTTNANTTRGAVGSTNLSWYWADLDDAGVPKSGLGLVEITNTANTNTAPGINNLGNLVTLMMAQIVTAFEPTAEQLGVTAEALDHLALLVAFQKAVIDGLYTASYTASSEDLAIRLRSVLKEVKIEDPETPGLLISYFTVAEPGMGEELIIEWTWPEPTP